MATWKFTVSDTYAERVGPSGVAGLVAVLRAGAKAGPKHDVKHVEEVLNEACDREGIALPAPEVGMIAGNLALHDLEEVLVTTDTGEPIERIHVANDVSQIPVEDRSDNVHLEPQDPRRPSVS